MSLRVAAGICALALFLTGCSGGGGGGGAGDKAFAISFSTSSVSMSALEGSPVPTSSNAVIQATGSGPQPDSLYIGATRTGTGVRVPIQVEINQTTNSATITLVPDVWQPAGTYTGTVTLLACKDANCNAHHRGSPHNVSYSVTIDSKLATEPNSATLSGVEGTSGATVPLQIRAPSGATVASAIIYSQGQGWLTATVQGPRLNLTPDLGGLLAGTYTAEVQLQTSAPAQVVRVPVTLTVSSALQAPTAVSLLLNGHTQPNVLQGSFMVAAATGASLSSWTAASDSAWLVADNTSGSPNGPLAWHLDPVALASIANFAEHTARITVSGGAAVTPVVFSVTVNKQLPEITNIDRLALLSNQAGLVTIYGGGFGNLTNIPTALHVTGATPSTASVLSDGMMTASFPALAAGSYTMTLPNALGIATRSKSITVLDPVTRNYETVATQGSKRSLIWDAVTQSAFVINVDLDSVMRFDLSGGTATLTARGIGGIEAIGLPLDRSVLYVLDRNGTLHDLNPADLSTVRTRPLGVTPYPQFLDLPLTITGDNVMWVTAGSILSGLFTYDLLQSAPKQVLSPNGDYFFYNGPWAAVSPNGQRLLMTQSSSVSPGPPMLYWDAADGRVFPFGANAPLKFFYSAATDRLGRKWSLDAADVRNFLLDKQGEIELPANWYGSHRAMSRDGTRLYVYALHENAIGTYSEPNPIVHYPRIYAFDISTPPIQTTSFPLLGQIDLPDYPACRATQGPDVCSPYGLSFTITDDDQTLLAVGDRQFLAIPIPANLR